MDEDRSLLGRLSKSGVEPPRVRLARLEGEPDLPVQPLRADGPRYEILGEIGRGGVGVVFRSLDVDLGRDVAMKVLREEHAGNPDVARRFLDEARIEGKLQHPGIVPIYDLGLQADLRPFFTMKLVRGEPYSSILHDRGGGARERRALSIFERVCQTIAYAHSRRVIHRDIKPSNVLTGEFGEVQVVDWGFAKVLEPAAGGEEAPQGETVGIGRLRSGTGSVAGVVMGTPAYMPPEQARGRVEEVDERSDVFALGAVLCEILTGDPPYVTENGNLLRQAMNGDLADAWQRLDSCDADEALVAIARRCLSRERENRPRDASELARVVSEHLVSVEDRAHRAELRSLAEREEAALAREQAGEARAELEEQKRKGRRMLHLAGALLLVILASGVGWFLVERGRAERARRASRAVDEVLQEAERLRGSGDLEGAFAATLRARDLAGEDSVGADLRHQAEALRQDVGAELAMRRAKEARRAEEAAAAASLLEARAAPPGSLGFAERLGAVTEALRKIGIDLTALSPEEAAERIRALDVADELTAALDSVSALLHGEGPGAAADASKLDEVVRLADSDPGRSEIRALAATRDLGALRDRARQARERSTPARTLALLGMELGVLGDSSAAVQLLTRARIEHPDDFWVTFGLAGACEALEPPDLETAVRMRSVCVALRPESSRLRERLAHSQSACGDAEGAAGTWRILGEKLLERGLLERAVSALTASEAACEEAGTEEPRNWCLLAVCRARQGEGEAAGELLDRVSAWRSGREFVAEDVLQLEREARAAVEAADRSR